MKVGIFTLTDKSFLCPDSNVKAGATVAGILPLKKSDPRGLYAFVETADDTESVSRKFLKLERTVELPWTRRPLMTHNEEVASQIEIVRNYLKTL